ncbi:MAG: family 20 glycosylhydrolase [Candidatus Sumerlaeota bacterium]|nr:family 20 glycosylhydrolase [Candidatus Sumerlaeota bacterium]
MTDKHNNFHIFAAAALALCAALMAPAPARAEWDSTETLSVELNGITMKFGNVDGPTILVDGVPFCSYGRFYAVKPGWAERFYAYDDDPDFVRKASASLTSQTQTANARRVTVALRKRAGFEGTQTFEVRADRSVRISVDARLTSDIAINLENKLGSIYPSWVIGRPFTYVETSGRRGSGAVSIVAQPGDAARNTLASNLRELTLDTRMGPVSFFTTGTLPARLIDYRKNLWNDPKWMIWLGMFETPMKYGKPAHYEAEFRFPPHGVTGQPRPAEGMAYREERVEVDAKTAEVKGVIGADKLPDRIIPTPKKIQWKQENLDLTNGIVFLSEGGPDAADFEKEAGQAIIGKIGSLSGAAPVSQKDHTATVTVRLNPKAALPAPKSGGQSTAADETYRVAVSASGAVLEARTTEGLSNAVKTWRQLLRAEHGKAFARGVEITDWPTLPFRGIHFFSGKNARALQTRMVREILGALKINRLVYQCEYIKWQSHPEIHNAKYGMDKPDAQAVADEARRQHIEIIPLINTFGHCEWLLDNPAMRNYADNPENPYAYDATNPAIYRVCEDIYKEAIAMFRPRIMHIGHDEITVPGFPMRPAGKKDGATAMILRDIEHYRRFLAGFGVRSMIWGDMFLAPGESPDACNAPTASEAKRRRQGLARDIMFADWHYAPAAPDKYRSLGILCSEGFDTVACPWEAAENIMCFAKAAARERATPKRGEILGTLQTTWAGYSFNDYSLWEAPRQYAAYVLAAEAAWNGGGDNAKAAPFDYIEEFNRIWHNDLFPRDGADGWTVDLNEAANFDLKPSAKDEWLGFKTKTAMADFPSGRQALGRFVFDLPGTPDAPKAVLLAGRFNPPGQWPKRLTLNIGDKATTLTFAVAATLAAALKPAIAATEIVYDDGTKEHIQWEPGGTLCPLESDESHYLTPLIWHKDRALPVNVHAYIWKNPQPGKTLSKIVFDSAGQGSALMLFGVSGVK